MQSLPKLRRLVLVALMVGATIIPTAAADGQAGGQQCPNLGSSSVVGEVTTPLASEISGITASKSQPGVFWIHNDSGNSSDLYAVNASGALLMRVILNNVPNWDYEDIAMGPGPDGSSDYIYIADVGANQLGRDTVRIFRLEEPKVTNGTITIPEAAVERFVFAYRNPTGPGTVNRNAEAMAVDPITGDVVVFEKALRTVDGIPASSWGYRNRQHELVEGEGLSVGDGFLQSRQAPVEHADDLAVALAARLEERAEPLVEPWRGARKVGLDVRVNQLVDKRTAAGGDVHHQRVMA